LTNFSKTLDFAALTKITAATINLQTLREITRLSIATNKVAKRRTTHLNSIR
jgi:hypothetical protein